MSYIKYPLHNNNHTFNFSQNNKQTSNLSYIISVTEEVEVIAHEIFMGFSHKTESASDKHI